MRHKYQTATSFYPLLEEYALRMRNNPTEAEQVLWGYLKGGRMGAHFRRQLTNEEVLGDIDTVLETISKEINNE